MSRKMKLQNEEPHIKIRRWRNKIWWINAKSVAQFDWPLACDIVWYNKGWGWVALEAREKNVIDVDISGIGTLAEYYITAVNLPLSFLKVPNGCCPFHVVSAALGCCDTGSRCALPPHMLANLIALWLWVDMYFYPRGSSYRTHQGSSWTWWFRWCTHSRYLTQGHALLLIHSFFSTENWHQSQWTMNRATWYFMSKREDCNRITESRTGRTVA